MKKLKLFFLAITGCNLIFAQTPFERVYTILNTKCQNANCHSSTSNDFPKFDGNLDDVYAAIYNVPPQNTTAKNKFEKLVKPGHPYMSFLLRKIAGAGFDTDLALENSEGQLMKDINGNVLSNKEIEFIRQWIMFSAKKNYGNNDFKPDWQLVSDYYDNPVNPFLPKPPKPAPGTGLQFRMGPIFLPATGEIEQEWLLQQEVNFPYLPEVYRIDGFMNQQSHHFLLFKFEDSSAVDRNSNDPMGMQKVSITGGSTSFDGDKFLTSAWQDDAEFLLPQNTALFWEQKTYLDMNYHIKNYNATGVLPCDFYYNIYFRPRNPNTIEMKAHLANDVTLFLPQGVQSNDFEDPANSLITPEWRYLWLITSHTHKYGIDFDIFIKDSLGNIGEQIYEGFMNYTTGEMSNYYDWEHPSVRYFPDFLPVKFGRHGTKRAGLLSRAKWNIQEPFVTFGFTTDDEMHLFYYFYTSENPLATSSVNNPDASKLSLQVYPNPMTGHGTVMYHLEKDAKKVSIRITDLTGKVIASFDETFQPAGLQQQPLDLQGIADGVYLVHVNVDGNLYTSKFIVAK
ncbi:MAG: T9SS type A sorting domain-containing protein [Chitinophagales bacterium]|nr:T9SS type A sorting domain-containing protein [Chitinophagales bacterium]MDW8417865.1 T9SS type A sorting domain-containing protein [Chitinophagales bacterium]